MAASEGSFEKVLRDRLFSVEQKKAFDFAVILATYRAKPRL
jgi:hypothetical protein